MRSQLFFDLDGTLTDPAVGIVGCYQHAIRAMGGMALDDRDLRRFIGPPLRDAIGEILGTKDLAVIEAAVEHYRERYSTYGLFENEVYGGVREMLAEVEAAGFGRWVVTSKPRVYAERILEHFGLRECFAGVYGAELSGERSTKAELIAHVLERQKIRPTEACMIGDRRHDIEGARAHAGVLGIGVLWGYGTREELEGAGANGIVERVEELLGVVERVVGSGR